MKVIIDIETPEWLFLMINKEEKIESYIRYHLRMLKINKVEVKQ